MYFLLLFILFVDFQPKEMKKNVWQNVVWSFVGILYFIIFFSDVSFASKDYERAVKIVPFHTEAIQEVLYSVTTKNEQLAYAEKALKYNSNVSGALEAYSNDYQEKNEWLKALEMEEKRLTLNHYKMYNYLVYADFLSKGLQYYQKENDLVSSKIFLEKIIAIEERIKVVLQKTNPLCYRTIHKPELEITDELEAFILNAKRLQTNGI